MAYLLQSAPVPLQCYEYITTRAVMCYRADYGELQGSNQWKIAVITFTEQDMDFQISGLDPARFGHLFNLGEAELAAQGVQRMVVTDNPGFPCRVALQDAKVGETVLLLNYVHLPDATPYRASHAIFVGENSRPANFGRNEIPDSISSRLISVRAYDSEKMMSDADVATGDELAPVLRRLLSNPAVDFLHLHNARRGCYAARVDKA
jgi:hypothetical protein